MSYYIIILGMKSLESFHHNHEYQSNSENLARFVFLKHPFWDLPFCLITDDVHLMMNMMHLLKVS